MLLEEKVVVVTGGTSSLGKVFVNRVLAGEFGMPKKIIVFSRDEAKQHDMRMSYLNGNTATDEIIYENFLRVLEFRIGDVRDYASICSVVKNANIVVNAAALKQVPSCEYFPTQAVLTNCMGAANIVRAIEENNYKVETVLAVSSDKACKPVNVMGMTKSIQERIIIAANILNPRTRFICVRYGNVLASRGSVIPLFHEQIRNGGPVTITKPEMTRFLLSLDEAVDAVFAALDEARPGETYIPRSPAAKVLQIAKALIGDRDIKIKTVGIRPGEKIHETLVSTEEANYCIKRGKYYSILPMLPELGNTATKEPRALKKEFSSADEVLSLSETIDLLKRHKLMVEDIDASNKEELLR